MVDPFSTPTKSNKEIQKELNAKFEIQKETEIENGTFLGNIYKTLY